ncbi:MAG: carboxypeptidase-like regulatory domain-containing protein [Acidobacteriota bacterium]
MKRRIYVTLAAAVVFLCIGLASAKAQIIPHSGRLEGRVINPSNNVPISNLKIKVIGKGETRTDQNGQYSFELPLGTYKVIIDDAEYAEHKKTITIRGGKTIVSNIRAAPLSHPRH